MSSSWLSAATELARTSPNRKWWLGAIIVDAQGRMVSAGTNSVSYGTDDPPFSCHAEEAAVEYMRSPGHTIYVARVRKGGTIGLARPCGNCTDLLRRAGIRRAVWTSVDGKPAHGWLE